MIWGLHGTPGGFLAPSWKQVPNKNLKTPNCSVLFWELFGVIFGLKSFFSVFAVCQILCLFWHRFWEASGRNFKDFGVISGCLLGSYRHLFADAVKFKKCNFSSEMLGLGSAGRPFLHYFCWLFEYVFDVAV